MFKLSKIKNELFKFASINYPKLSNDNFQDLLNRLMEAEINDQKKLNHFLNQYTASFHPLSNEVSPIELETILSEFSDNANYFLKSLSVDDKNKLYNIFEEYLTNENEIVYKYLDEYNSFISALDLEKNSFIEKAAEIIKQFCFYYFTAATKIDLIENDKVELSMLIDFVFMLNPNPEYFEDLFRSATNKKLKEKFYIDDEEQNNSIEELINLLSEELTKFAKTRGYEFKIDIHESSFINYISKFIKTI